MNFLYDDWQIITLQRLYKSFYNRDFTKDVWNIPDTGMRIKFLTEHVERLTKLDNFGEYLAKVLTIDAFFLNEDRHLHNIAVLMNSNGKFDYCPIFDQGAALMSDTSADYPLGVDFIIVMEEVKAKTICQSFEEALDEVEKLYGLQLRFSFDRNDVNKLMGEAEMYTDEEKNRVKTIVYQQMRKYQYLFE